MKNGRSLLSSIPVFALLFGLIPVPANAAAVPAMTAFDEAFAKVNDYTVTLSAHEVLGNRTQNRVYHYWFKRPSLAKTLIASGDGAGSGGVWNGGDKVSGHQGGMLAFIHLKVDLHDGRAVSLRGYTIPDGLIQNEVDKFKQMPGDLTQHDGPAINDEQTDEIDLKLADPASYGGITRIVMYLSKETHFPLRQIRYVGDLPVADETWSNLKTNVGLNDSDFPF